MAGNCKGTDLNDSETANSIIALELRINGVDRSAHVDTRVTLLDALRNTFQLPGTKKGCDQGACGADANIVAAVKHSLQCVSDEARP